MSEKYERDFKGVWIPREIIEKYGWKKGVLISAFIQKAPDLTKMQIKKVNKIINNKCENYNKIKEILLNSKSINACNWCGSYCLNLIEHHFPISKHKGGKDIVKICGTCHNDFHYIESTGIINQEIYKYFNKE